MNDPRVAGTLTYQQFLEFVSDKDERYEYVDGHAVGMGIPSDVHQLMVKALDRRFDAALGSRPCNLIPSASLWTGTRERAPDLMVVCGKREPKVIVEVLSPNRGDDLGSKVKEYSGLPSINEYLVVDSTIRWVRRYYRNNNGELTPDIDRINGSVRIEFLDYVLNIDELYEEVEPA